MNFPRSTDQARDQLTEAVKTATPIQLLMFLVIFQAVQIVDYLQKVQKSLPTPRKSLPPPEPVSTCTDSDPDWAIGSEDTLGERFAEEFWQQMRENRQTPWTQLSVSYRSTIADNPEDPNAVYYVEQGDGPSLQMGGYIEATWMEESQEMTPAMMEAIREAETRINGLWDTGKLDAEAVYHRRMADAQRHRHQILEDIARRDGPCTFAAEPSPQIDDVLDRERQIRFEHLFPGYGFDQEKYQYAMDYDGNTYMPHPFSEDREAALRFKYEARRFEIQNGEGRYTIAGMPSHTYRDMQRRDQDRNHFGMVGYCTPSRDMFTNGPTQYAPWL